MRGPRLPSSRAAKERAQAANNVELSFGVAKADEAAIRSVPRYPELAVVLKNAAQPNPFGVRYLSQRPQGFFPVATCRSRLTLTTPQIAGEIRDARQLPLAKRAAPYPRWRFPGDRHPLVIAGDAHTADRLGGAVARSGLEDGLALFLIEQTADESEDLGSLLRRKGIPSVRGTRLPL